LNLGAHTDHFQRQKPQLQFTGRLYEFAKNG
jgi:hypothetical protein